MSHRHDWHWIGQKPGDGEFCSTCGRYRDRDPRLPEPVILRATKGWVAK